MHGSPRLAPAVLLAAAACGDPSQTTASTSHSDTSVTATTDATTTVTTATPTTGDDPNPTTTTSSASDSLSGSSTGDPATTTTTATTTTATTATTDTTTDTTGEVEACACPDLEVPLDDGIFVLSSDAELWKYFPKTNSFEMLGALNCPGLFPGTFSMAVDRTGFAWVQFTAGELRKISVSDVSNCEDPGFDVGQQDVPNFGMAFVSNSANDPCDRIYGNSFSGNGFVEGDKIGDFITIDPVNLQLSKLGKTNFDGAEVSGTGDGRAFIFGGSNPSKLVELDKQDGSTVTVLPLGTLEINTGGFAFASFAGDFYLFTDSDNDNNSEVTRLDYDDSDNNGKQDLKVVLQDVPLRVVGAGVSTCAPLIPQ